MSVNIYDGMDSVAVIVETLDAIPMRGLIHRRDACHTKRLADGV